MVKLSLRFTKGGQLYQHWFAVVEGDECLGHSMILAMDFLVNHSVTIDFSDSSLIIQGETIKLNGRKECAGMIGVMEIAQSIHPASVNSTPLCTISSGSDLEEDDKLLLNQLLTSHAPVFASTTLELGETKDTMHKVDLTTDRPINKSQYPLPQRLRPKIRSRISQFLEAGVIEPSMSAWNSPLVIREKKDGDIRLVLDSSAINQVTKKMDYPLVRIEEALYKLAGSKWYSVLDLESGYHQVVLHPDTRPYFAFRTPWGKFQFRRLPMGATNSAFHFQKIMEVVLRDLISDQVIVFQDDILIATSTVPEHLELLDKVLQRFKEWGVTIKIKKCLMARKQVEYLGHVVTSEGFTPKPANLCHIRDFVRPTTKRAVRKFMGQVNFFARFIPHLAEMATPITNLTKGHKQSIKWGNSEEMAFNKIKQALDAPITLAYPNYNKPFVLQVDTTPHAFTVELSQQEGNTLTPVGYYGRKFSTAEVNYSLVEQQALAVVSALDHYHSLIYGFPLEIRSAQRSLEYLKSLKSGNSRLQKWGMKLLSYSPFIHSTTESPSTTLHPDLSCSPTYPIQHNEADTEIISSIDTNSMTHETDVAPPQTTYPLIITYEDPPKWDTTIPTIFTDGSCLGNGTNEAIGAVGIFWDNNKEKSTSMTYQGRQTNNAAEIVAVIKALDQAIHLGYKTVRIATDSQFVIYCACKYLKIWKDMDWKLTSGKDVVNRNELQQLSSRLQQLDVLWIYTPAHTGIKGNEEANRLAQQAAGEQLQINLSGRKKYNRKSQRSLQHATQPTVLMSRTVPTKQQAAVRLEGLISAQELCPTVQQMKKELAEGNKVMQPAMGLTPYINLEGILCMKGQITLGRNDSIEVDAIFVPQPLRGNILWTVHSSKWNVHPGFETTCTKLLEHFFWPNFRSDVRRFIKACQGCQHLSVNRTKAPIQLFVKPSAPFEKVAADILGPLITSEKGYKYILNIIDLFSRYLISIPLMDQKAETIAQALEVGLISRHGCPRSIMTDRGACFRSTLLQEVCRMLGISQTFSGPWRPQTNGMVERANRTIKSKLVHLCQNAGRKWDQRLHLAELSYNTSIHSSTGRSPAEVAFGRKLTYPSPTHQPEWDIPISIDSYCKELRSRLLQIHRQVSQRDQRTQCQRTQRINKGRKLITFQPGDLVLYRKPRVGKTRKHGFRYPYEGPYRVITVVSTVSYDIRKMNDSTDGTLTRAHVDHLKAYTLSDTVPKSPRISRPPRIIPSTPQLDDMEEDSFNYYQAYRDPTRDANLSAPISSITTPEPAHQEDRIHDQQGYHLRSRGKIVDSIWNRHIIKYGRIIATK